jgi:hypothetical protein
MSYGLEVYKEDGSISLSSEDSLTRFIEYFVVGQDTSGSKTYPGLAGQSIVVMSHNLDGYWFVHRTWVVGNTIYWGRGTVPSDWYVGPTGLTVIAVG